MLAAAALRRRSGAHDPSRGQRNTEMPQPVPQRPLPTVPIPNFLGLTEDSEQGQQQRGAAGQDTSGAPGSGAVHQGEHGSAGSRGALPALGSARPGPVPSRSRTDTHREPHGAAFRSQPRRAAQELRSARDPPPAPPRPGIRLLRTPQSPHTQHPKSTHTPYPNPRTHAHNAAAQVSYHTTQIAPQPPIAAHHTHVPPRPPPAAPAGAPRHPPAPLIQQNQQHGSIPAVLFH